MASLTELVEQAVTEAHLTCLPEVDPDLLERAQKRVEKAVQAYSDRTAVVALLRVARKIVRDPSAAL